MVRLHSFLVFALLPTSAFAQSTEAPSRPETVNAPEGATSPPVASPQESASGVEGASSGSPGFDEEDSIPLKQPRATAEQPRQAAAVRQAPERTRLATPAPSTSASSESNSSKGTEQSEEGDDESPQFGYFGIGPTTLSIAGYDEYGLALAGGGRFPFHERMALNAGVSWGLTTFDRTGEWWEGARRIGSWTTRAYGNVTEWVSEGDDDDDVFRAIAAFYAYFGLLFPYAVSGMMYILGPFAATSYLDFHMEATFHLLETRKGPYAGAGLGTAAIIFPLEGEMKGAFGPSFNLGYDFGWFGVEGRGFYSPPHLHGEPSVYSTDIFTGQFLLRFQGK